MRFEEELQIMLIDLGVNVRVKIPGDVILNMSQMVLLQDTFNYSPE